VDLAKQHGLKVIATNDCHYLDKSDSEAHEALLCIQTQTTLDDEGRFKFETSEFHFRSPEEMKNRFADWPDTLSNTVELAERCNVEIPLHQRLIPTFPCPDGKKQEDYLCDLVREGLNRRYKGAPTQVHLDRAEYELNVINQKGYADYFLVVWDIIKSAREMGIPVGPGRGSGAGSLVAFALEITNIDPIRYALLFERFLNPERPSMPDFDLDFCFRRREEIIQRVREQYGADKVGQIATFNRMLAKSVVRDVCRVMGMPYGDGDRIAKLVPDELKVTLSDALDKEPELRQLIEEDPQIARLWHLASRIEGTIRAVGVHAAGVIICDEPLMNHVALYKASNSEVIATQVDMSKVEEVGLLKMDFLGLKTLTVVHDAVGLVKTNHGIEIDIDHIEPNDAATYELLRSGNTMGVFQLESSGMRELSKRIGLESLEEICALVALYRPGPMALKDQYIECKHSPEKIQYDHPLLEPILKETYGVALYQEQVMQIVQAVAKYSLGQADILRRAMGKKKVELMAEQRDKFVEGAAANGIDKETASRLFSKIEQFAGYGFNKSHSLAYAFVAYQTAFLKANYGVEFMTALLTSESGSPDKIALYVEECRRMGIEVLPPDVNHSLENFSVEDGKIRFGLSAIKNVGEEATRAIVAERNSSGEKYKDIFDFCARLNGRETNRRLLESFNKAGVFVSTGWNRRQVEAVLDEAIREAQITQKEKDSGQSSLFDLMDPAETASTLHVKPNVPEWPENEILQFEKDILGLYVSSHPLAKYSSLLERYSTIRVSDIEHLREGQEVTLGGIIVTPKIHVTKNGKKMAFVTLDTLEGPCEITVFSDLYELNAGLVVADMILMVPCKVSVRNGENGLIANDLIPADEIEARLTKAVHVRLSTTGLDEGLLNQVAETLGERQGSCDVYLHCFTPEHKEIVVHATNACRTAASPSLRDEVEALLGPGTLWFSAGSTLPRH
jgi:DNA polymerase-3 subunit alpha